MCVQVSYDWQAKAVILVIHTLVVFDNSNQRFSKGLEQVMSLTMKCHYQLGFDATKSVFGVSENAAM